VSKKEKLQNNHQPTKHLVNISEIYCRQFVIGIDSEDHYFRGCIHNMLAEPQEEGLFSTEQVIDQLVNEF